ATFIPFTAQTRMSAVHAGASSVRKGAVDAILNYVGGGTSQAMASGNTVRALQSNVNSEVAREIQAISDEIAKAGGTPLAVAKDGRLLGIVHLKDIVKGGIRERFAELRRMGIRTVMITGDNPMTAAAIAAEAGVDDFLAQATPEDKLKLIRDEQAKGKLVAMCGDGTNDAKYFAIIPAMFLAFYPQLAVLNVMHLASPQSAILSAIIFNALIIIALIPLALKGVAYRAIGAGALLQRNLMVY